MTEDTTTPGDSERRTDNEASESTSATDAPPDVADLAAENRVLRERVDELETALTEIHDRLDDSTEQGNSADSTVQDNSADSTASAGDDPVLMTSGGQDCKVIGEFDSSSGIGVYGHNQSTTGTATGVKGETNSSDSGATAVRGEATASTGETYGVFGSVPSPDGNGVVGSASTDSVATLQNPVGVYGYTDRTDNDSGVDDAAFGVIGRAKVPDNSTGVAHGVVGTTTSPNDNSYGLLSLGDAGVNGNLGLAGAVDTAETDFVVQAGTTNTENAQNVLLGHASNEVTSGATAATVGGGGFDNGTDLQNPNKVHSNYATVGGGLNNDAGDPDTTDDPVPGASATVAGGNENEASGSNSTVGGGTLNEATADNATVVGGDDNTASAEYATVLGGQDNTASGKYSIAAGNNATASKDGQVVFTDSTTNTPSTSTADRFIGNFTGGYRLETDSSNMSAVYLQNGDSSWSSLSDPATKTNIRGVDSDAVLDGVTDLDISRWSYEWQTEIEHIGPMAGDLYETFGIGRDDGGIQTIDAFGVLFAALQGLAARVEKLEAGDDSGS